jgi:peptide/nickel transport system permease protein
VSLLNFVIRRVSQLIPMLAITSVLIFFIIELPPGDYLTMRIIQLENQGTIMSDTEIARLKDQYGLDKPLITRYFMWMWNILRYGDFGRSFGLGKPVSEVIGQRIALTMLISLFSLLFVWAVAIPIGIYSAVRQYSTFDYGFTFVGFIGLAVPNFLLALSLVYISFAYFDHPITGLFSPEYLDAPWSWLKVRDMLGRIWLPVIVIGMGGTASLIRITRGTLLDELRKPYVMTARAKGVVERKLLLKYPVRIAINPLISTIGWLLPSLVSGTAITAIVLNLPTMGPVLLQALLAQDMYLAGSFLLILSVLTMVGTLLSDILLAVVDPRIRYGGISE